MTNESGAAPANSEPLRFGAGHLRILQIVPTIAPGTGVGGVADALEREFRSAGVETMRFTLREARGSWIPSPSHGLAARGCSAAQVIWFSTVGTVLARRVLRRLPDTMSICHNDALVGDVYINHGLLRVAMRARGHVALRMTRNPLHLFTELRDTIRYGRRSPHRVVVNLTAEEERAMRRLHPRLRSATTIVGNGIDTERFRPATNQQRSTARAAFGIGPDADVALFVGHEHGRKGLRPLIEAIAGTSVQLLVVGGGPDEVSRSRAFAENRGASEQVTFTGRLADPVMAYAASDVFAQPSAYEAHSLALLEGLACGLPVVATPVGSAPELISDGVNGKLCNAAPYALRAALMEVLGPGLEGRRRAARATALDHSWSAVAARYLSVVQRIHPQPDGARS